MYLKECETMHLHTNVRQTHLIPLICVWIYEYAFAVLAEH